MEAFISGKMVAVARTDFSWLEDGKFLRQFTTVDPAANLSPEWEINSPLPVTAIIGLDDATGDFTMLFGDGRGVRRVYAMTMDEGVLRMWRAEPGLHQRFSATLSADGKALAGAWEASEDGVDWKHDFDVTYTRLDI
jgi:hypothetical protein